MQLTRHSHHKMKHGISLFPIMNKYKTLLCDQQGLNTNCKTYMTFCLLTGILRFRSHWAKVKATDGYHCFLWTIRTKQSQRSKEKFVLALAQCERALKVWKFAFCTWPLLIRPLDNWPSSLIGANFPRQNSLPVLLNGPHNWAPCLIGPVFCVQIKRCPL